jgi:hypothetical protein
MISLLSTFLTFFPSARLRSLQEYTKRVPYPTPGAESIRRFFFRKLSHQMLQPSHLLLSSLTQTTPLLQQHSGCDSELLRAPWRSTLGLFALHCGEIYQYIYYLFLGGYDYLLSRNLHSSKTTSYLRESWSFFAVSLLPNR